MHRGRVCHFTCAHSFDDTRVFHKECIALVKAGFEVFYIVPNAQTGIVDGVRIIGVPAKSLNPIYRLLFLSRRVYREVMKIDADIYQFHDIELFNYGVKLKKQGKRVIFDSHENWFGYIKNIKWFPWFIKNYVENFLKRLYSKNLHSFDKVITVSPHIVDILSKYSSDVELITNYPLIKDDSFNNFSFDDYLKRPNIACYSGTVYEMSLQENVILAMSRIRNIKYQIIGNISRAYKQKLISIDNKGTVEFINFMSKKELELYYNNSVFGIAIFDYIPNLGGTLGSLGVNKIYEYMAKGLPVICTDFELWKSFISKYQCGILVNPHDILSIQTAIEYLLYNKYEAYIMGKNAQKAIRDEFNWDVEGNKYIKIVESTISHNINA